MTCPVEEKLKTEMLAAIHKQNLALGMSAERACALGEKLGSKSAMTQSAILKARSPSTTRT